MKFFANEYVNLTIKMRDALLLIEEAFVDFFDGKSKMPSKVYLDLPEFHGDFRAMPAYSKRHGLVGIKWVNSHSKNREKGLPTVMANMIVNDAETGVAQAVIEAGVLTSLRTGAAGGVAVKYLARRDAKILGMIGCGVQAYYQILAILEVRNIEEIRLFDMFQESAEGLQIKIAPYFTGKIEIVDSPELAVRGVDILVTSTPSYQPVVKSDWVEDGVHINAVGADAEGKQELESEILVRGIVVVDDVPQASHSGEVNVPLHEGTLNRDGVNLTLGAVIQNGKLGRRLDSDITVFDSTGLAIQDLALAAFLLKVD